MEKSNIKLAKEKVDETVMVLHSKKRGQPLTFPQQFMNFFIQYFVIPEYVNFYENFVVQKYKPVISQYSLVIKPHPWLHR